MKRKAVVTSAVGLGLAATLGLLAGLALAQGGGPVIVQTSTAPTVVSYQGEVLVNGQPYSGTGYFKFAVVNALGTTAYWSNDGTSSGGQITPTNAVPLSVQDGLFSVLLGNPVEQNMTQPISATVFADRGRRLQVWFSQDQGGPFTDLGRTAIAAVPYALNAETLDGMDGSYFDQHYHHVVVVAKSGGDYSTINEALASITDNGEYSRYLVWVAPGIYSETVQMKPYVAIQGAGAGVTVLFSMVSSSSGFPPAATVVVTENVRLRDVAVVVTGTGLYKAAILVRDVATDTAEIADVLAEAGGGTVGYGIYNLYAAPIIRDAILSGEGSAEGYGIYDRYSSPTIQDATARGKGGSSFGVGIYGSDSSSTIRDSVADGESATDEGFGIKSINSSLTIRETTATGQGGTHGHGIRIQDSPTTIQNTIASGKGETEGGYGISIRDCSLTAQNSVTSGEGNTNGYGLVNVASGGSYTVTVDSCQLAGDTYAINNDAEFTVYVGASLLDGGVDTDGTYKCVGSYDVSYTEVLSNCQSAP